MRYFSGVPRLVLLAACAAGAACECDNPELRTFRSAVESFVHFNEPPHDPEVQTPRPRRPPGRVRARRDNPDMPGRHRLEVDLELPYDLPVAEIERLLGDAVRAVIAGTHYHAVRVRAWPGSLARYGGTLGVAVYSLDGQGWEANPPVWRDIRATLTPGARKPTALDIRLLEALEAAHEALAAEARAAGREPDERAIAVRAIARAAKGSGVSEGMIAGALARARAYYGQER